MPNRMGRNDMKRKALRSETIIRLPLAWREAEYAQVVANHEDAGDDRVRENMFDSEDERLEVGAIVQGMRLHTH